MLCLNGMTFAGHTVATIMQRMCKQHWEVNMQCRTKQDRHFLADVGRWTLQLTGQVDKPLDLNIDGLRDLPAIEMPIAIACIGSSGRYPLIKQAVWKGVPLREVLNEEKINTNTTHAQFTAVDGYSTYLPIDLLTDALLVFGVDGHELRPEQGYPLRLVVPGVYGYKMPKWIERIELTQMPVPGQHELQGWSASGQVQTTSHIFAPHHMQTVSGVVRFSGVAYAGVRAITQVEVSIDDADWTPVAFTPSIPGSWTRWQAEWQPYAPGDYVVRVRATDSDGFTQVELSPTIAFPNGSNAIHSIVIRITSSLEVVPS